MLLPFESLHHNFCPWCVHVRKSHRVVDLTCFGVAGRIINDRAGSEKQGRQTVGPSRIMGGIGEFDLEITPLRGSQAFRKWRPRIQPTSQNHGSGLRCSMHCCCRWGMRSLFLLSSHLTGAICSAPSTKEPLLVLLATFCLGSTLSGTDHPCLPTGSFVDVVRVRAQGNWLWPEPDWARADPRFGRLGPPLDCPDPPGPEGNPDRFLRPFWHSRGFLAEIGCMVNALLVLVARSAGDLTEPPCSWTDWFGALTCLIIGTIVLLGSLAVLS